MLRFRYIFTIRKVSQISSKIGAKSDGCHVSAKEVQVIVNICHKCERLPSCHLPAQQQQQ